MPQYTVKIVETVFAFTDIEVEAKSKKAAVEKALELFENDDYEGGSEVDWDSSTNVEVVVCTKT